MSKVKDLQKANLDTPEKIAKAQPKNISLLFNDEKVTKQIIAAAKRVSKKRTAGEESTSSPRKRSRQEKFDVRIPTDLESSLALPSSSADEDELANTVVITNRAPLVLAFTVILLKHTMPEQPLSSRLSLAQGYVSTTSRARAVSLGIQELSKDEEESERKLGEGQPTVTIMGKELKGLRRWGYEWKQPKVAEDLSTQSTLQGNSEAKLDGKLTQDEGGASLSSESVEADPPLWALDLEALRKSNRADFAVANTQAGNHSNLPIYTPQSARAYLMKSFDSPTSSEASVRKQTATAKAADKERNLGRVLCALDKLYDSWAATIGPEELDKRTWSWYVKVRPEVKQGAAGWGGKNEVRIGDILALRRNS